MTLHKQWDCIYKILYDEGYCWWTQIVKHLSIACTIKWSHLKIAAILKDILYVNKKAHWTKPAKCVTFEYQIKIYRRIIVNIELRLTDKIINLLN